MQAIQITQTGSSEVLTYNEVTQPQAGQVLVKIHAAPVNFIDTIIREGNLPLSPF